MKAISIQSRLGSCGLSIQARLREGKEEQAGKLAAMHLLFHNAGSAVFGGKEKRERSEAYSEALAADVSKAIEEAFEDIFEAIEIKTSAYTKENEADKLIRALEKIGATEAADVLRKQQAGKNGSAEPKAAEESLG